MGNDDNTIIKIPILFYLDQDFITEKNGLNPDFFLSNGTSMRDLSYPLPPWQKPYPPEKVLLGFREPLRNTMVYCGIGAADPNNLPEKVFLKLRGPSGMLQWRRESPATRCKHLLWVDRFQGGVHAQFQRILPSLCNISHPTKFLRQWGTKVIWELASKNVSFPPRTKIFQ